MIRDILHKVAQGYEAARKDSLGDHQLAKLIRDDARESLQRAAASQGEGIKFQGSPGQGNWAKVPWLAAFDPIVTESAMTGYYVVYLFAADMTSVSLSLNQGTTAVQTEFGRQTRDVLRERAALMRARVPEGQALFSSEEIDLKTNHYRALNYEAGHALGKRYNTSALPEEDDLAYDLQEMLRLYRTLTFRGGLDPTPEFVEGNKPPKNNETIIERRRYRYHRSIERSSNDKVKRVLGYRCQACSFDFEKRYGEIGKGFIEAHHLRPLSELPEGEQVSLDPKSDFAVLCANCHRMIHRTGAPRKLEDFQRLIKVSNESS